ncbi:MAG: hypothetical protein M3072_13755, partial [Candidatus Dormibacteraeota bacterium]|nr:hypothetical protein [Candidatus Dormibacteraeota bacterium]
MTENLIGAFRPAKRITDILVERQQAWLRVRGNPAQRRRCSRPDLGYPIRRGAGSGRVRQLSVGSLGRLRFDGAASAT